MPPRDERGRHAAHVARNSHGRGGGHAAPDHHQVAIRAANRVRGHTQAHPPPTTTTANFIVRQATRAGAWTDAASALIEDDDDMTHPLYVGLKFPDYEFREYPKWVEGVIVNDEDEEARVLDGKKLLREPDERVRMLAICDVKKIIIDKRWGLDKIRKAIIAAGEDPEFDPRL